MATVERATVLVLSVALLLSLPVQITASPADGATTAPVATAPPGAEELVSRTNLALDLGNDTKIAIGRLVGSAADIERMTTAAREPAGLHDLLEVTVGPLELHDLRISRGFQTVAVERLAIGRYSGRRVERLEVESLLARGPSQPRIKLGQLAVELVDLGVTAELRDRDPLTIIRQLERIKIDGLQLGVLEIGDAKSALALSGLRLDHAGAGLIRGLEVSDVNWAFRQPRRTLRLDQVALGELDWRRVELAIAANVISEVVPVICRYRDRLARAGRGEPTNHEPTTLQEHLVSLDFYTKILAKLVVGPFRLAGFGAADEKGELTLRDLTIGGFHAGRTNAMGLAGLVVGAADGSGVVFELGRLATNEVGFAADLAEQMEALPRTEEGVQRAHDLAWQADRPMTIRAEAIELRRDRQRVVALGSARMTQELVGTRKQIEADITGLDIDLTAAVPKPKPEIQQQLSMLGVAKLALSARGRLAYDRPTGQLAFEDLTIGATSIGSMTGSMELLLEENPFLDPGPALATSKLVGAELRYQDQGLVEHVVTMAVARGNQPRAPLVARMIQSMRRAEPARSLLDADMVDVLTSFLTTPAGLVLRLHPAEPLPLPSIATTVMAAPQRFNRAMGLTLEAE